MQVEDKFPIHSVFACTEMIINETLLGWRCVKSGWQQDSQGAFELELKRISSSRESRTNALRMNRIAALSSAP